MSVNIDTSDVIDHARLLLLTGSHDLFYLTNVYLSASVEDGLIVGEFFRARVDIDSGCGKKLTSKLNSGIYARCRGDRGHDGVGFTPLQAIVQCLVKFRLNGIQMPPLDESDIQILRHHGLQPMEPA
jgi:hypothetical protein